MFVFWYGKNFLRKYPISQRAMIVADNALWNQRRDPGEPERGIHEGIKFPPDTHDFDHASGSYRERTKEEMQHLGLLDVPHGFQYHGNDLLELAPEKKFLRGLISLSALQKHMQGILDKSYEAHIHRVTGKYTAAEMIGWPFKLIEARMYLGMSAAEKATNGRELTVYKEAAIRFGENALRADQYIVGIAAKGEAFQLWQFQCTGTRDLYRDRIAAVEAVVGGIGRDPMEVILELSGIVAEFLDNLPPIPPEYQTATLELGAQ